MIEPPASDEMQAMLRDIRADVRLTFSYTGRNALAPRVMAAMARVPRHAFVPARLRGSAYLNQPLPIGHGQTISQPYIVALMTDLLDPRPEHRVLEVGTGCGYQAAVLAELVAEVYTLEVVAPLLEAARERLARLGYDNVQAERRDGWQGWPEAAPFDAILVAAAAPQVPPALVEQLRPGGRMAIPVGPRYGSQELLLLEKNSDGGLQRRKVLPVAFVPLTGGPPPVN
jgi:protein-L-isoaspartate(D-aspartate) O-methyltransferase